MHFSARARLRRHPVVGAANIGQGRIPGGSVRTVGPRGEKASDAIALVIGSQGIFGRAGREGISVFRPQKRIGRLGGELRPGGSKGGNDRFPGIPLLPERGTGIGDGHRPGWGRK